MLSRFVRQMFRRPAPAAAASDHLERGRQCLAAGQEGEGRLHLRAAFELQPDSADILESLSLALGMAGELPLAREAAQKALARRPRSVPARLCMGNVLTREERYDEAIRAYREALEIDPDNAFVHYNLAIALGTRGDTPAALAHYRRTVEILPDRPDEHGSILFLLNADWSSSAEAIAAEHRRWGERFADPLMRRTRHSNVPDPERRLRIGYVSGDFVGHAASSFIEPILAHHDPVCFEVVCFASAAEIPSEGARHGARWHRIPGMSDEAAAEFIEAEGIDILVDLSGHTRRNRLLVFARKPAPVQITMLGYPNTVGFPAMDYRITDVHGDPPGRTEHLFCERLLRLPHSLWCYAPSPSMPPVSPPPCVAAGHVTLASLNAAYKLNPRALDAWTAILRSEPAARFLVVTIPKGEAQTRIRAHFEARGIAGDRIEVVDRLPVSEYWKQLERVDLALDAFPCNGGATTCESLWLGVPTVTLGGATFRERAGLSLLTNVGLSELVTHDVGRYVETAVGLARDPARLASMRAGLRERMRGSPLLDAQGHVRELETLYREAWREWCAGGARRQ